jgi:hypothetical protein
MKKFILISSLFILPVSSGIYMIKDDIYNKYLNTGNVKQKKDETRFNSNYYGLSWGSRTDEIVQ